MPYIKVQTSRQVKEPEKFLQKISSLTAAELGKPESYVMTALEDNVVMTLGGTAEPAAFVELKSIGLTEEKTGDLSRVLCDTLNQELGLDEDRIYINFRSVPGSMWGWKGSTF